MTLPLADDMLVKFVELLGVGDDDDDDDGVGDDDNNGDDVDNGVDDDDDDATLVDAGRFVIKTDSSFPVNSSGTMNLYAHNVHNIMYINE